MMYFLDILLAAFLAHLISSNRLLWMICVSKCDNAEFDHSRGILQRLISHFDSDNKRLLFLTVLSRNAFKSRRRNRYSSSMAFLAMLLRAANAPFKNTLRRAL